MDTRRFFRTLALAAAFSTLAACAGMPLSTMWHFRNFGPKDFLQTDPSTVRAAIQLDDGVSLGSTPPELNVALKFKDEPEQKFRIPLVVLKEGPWVGAGTGKAEAGKHWYLLALSDKGVRAYRQLQQTLNGNLDAAGHFRKHGSFTVGVRTNPLRYSDAAEERLHKTGSLFLQSRLELSAKDGFYTLYKGDIKLTRQTVDTGAS